MTQTQLRSPAVPLGRLSTEILDREIADLFTNRSGSFASFFADWIKSADHADRLFGAVGQKGENYLQYRLQQQDVREALIVLEITKAHWEAHAPDRIHRLVSHEDSNANGIWHYLADNVRRNEGAETMEMARILLALDVEIAQQNEHGIGPLGKILTPDPKWPSLNALVQTGHLSIAHVEQAIVEQARGDEARAQQVNLVFRGDLGDNGGRLSQHALEQALNETADPALRAATCRLFFDYADPGDGATAFFNLVTLGNHEMFEALLRLLTANANDVVSRMSGVDATMAKTLRQVYLCRTLLQRDTDGEGILFKAMAAGKMSNLHQMTALLINDNLAVKKLVRGEPVRRQVVIDQASPAPANPLLSLLLQPDRVGNTVFHRAILTGELSALEGFLTGLPSNDIHAILTRVANAGGLTPIDLTVPERARAKLIAAVKIGRLDKAAAQAQMTAVNKVPAEIAAYVKTKLDEIEGLAADTSMRGLPPPNFDPKKVGGLLPTKA